MINLSDELETLAAAGAEGADRRLGDADAKALLRARVARAKRRANATIAVAVVAVLGVGAVAWATPRAPAPLSPSPSATSAISDGQLPALDTDAYLVHMVAAHHTYEALRCETIPDVAVSPDEVDYPGVMPPLPTWIEADRIYGLADGLPEHYPIPLYSRDGTAFYDLAVREISQLYPSSVEVVVALIAADGSWWGFDADFSVIDAMPFDAPGVFVTLTPNPDCQGGPRAIDRSRIPPGHYDARVMVVRDDGRLGNAVTDYGDVEIVTGLPSIPSLNVTE